MNANRILKNCFSYYSYDYICFHYSGWRSQKQFWINFFARQWCQPKHGFLLGLVFITIKTFWRFWGQQVSRLPVIVSLGVPIFNQNKFCTYCLLHVWENRFVCAFFERDAQRLPGFLPLWNTVSASEFKEWGDLLTKIPTSGWGSFCKRSSLVSLFSLSVSQKVPGAVLNCKRTYEFRRNFYWEANCKK